MKGGRPGYWTRNQPGERWYQAWGGRGCRVSQSFSIPLHPSLPALLPHLPLPLLLQFFPFLPLTILHSFSFALSRFLNSHFHCPFSFPYRTLLSLLLSLSLFTTTVQRTFLTWKCGWWGQKDPYLNPGFPTNYDLSRLALACQGLRLSGQGHIINSCSPLRSIYPVLGTCRAHLWTFTEFILIIICEGTALTMSI